MDFKEAATKNIEEILRELEGSLDGISDKQIKERIEVFGKNTFKIKEKTFLEILLRQIKNPFIYILFSASIISFLIGEKIDAILIIVFVLINLTLSFFQEYKATKTVSLLNKYFVSKIKVKRKGKEKIISEEDLVPGDIVILESGDIVPSDIRILEAQNLLVDESILTGESLPVEKNAIILTEIPKEAFEAKNILFAKTSISSGKAIGVVFATGFNTYFGKISKKISSIKRESIFEKEILYFAHLILKIVLFTIFCIFFAKLLISKSKNILDFALFCVALVVTILPEALPLVTIFTFSNGALKLTKKNVIVKRLSSIEDLGNIEILCTDKTGTLTENYLVLEKIYSQEKNKALEYALFSSSFATLKKYTSSGSFDKILWKEAKDNIKSKIRNIKIISEIPFDSFRMKNSVLIEDENKKRILIVKGAPEIILNSCQNISLEIKNDIEKIGKEGKRVLAIAFKELNKDKIDIEDEKELNFLGYFVFQNPLKNSAIDAINLAKKMNVKIKMITGDSKEVAGYIGKKIGLIENLENVILGEELEKLNDNDFKKVCDTFSIFARVSPLIKYKIVKTLQEKYTVGFLGDGINDVPALKASQVAIVVDSASNLAKEEGDILLLKKDLKVIIDGIQEGRCIFANVNKYIKYALSTNFGNFYSMAIISLFIKFLPMLPTQILLENLLSDLPAISIASDNVDLEELQKPRTYKISSFINLILILAIISSLFDFIFFAIFRKSEPFTLRTAWFVMSLLTEIALLFSIRTNNFFLKAKKPGSILLFFSFLIIFIALFLPYSDFGKAFFDFSSLSFKNLFLLIFLVILYFITTEFIKLIYLNFSKKLNQNKNNNLK
ncbi:MAG: cation-translocating P-type ATPase [Minisyncoccia bacterium]